VKIGRHRAVSEPTVPVESAAMWVAGAAHPGRDALLPSGLGGRLFVGGCGSEGVRRVRGTQPSDPSVFWPASFSIRQASCLPQDAEAGMRLSR
jgi:hypothetical protein